MRASHVVVIALVILASGTFFSLFMMMLLDGAR